MRVYWSILLSFVWLSLFCWTFYIGFLLVNTRFFENDLVLAIPIMAMGCWIWFRMKGHNRKEYSERFSFWVVIFVYFYLTGLLVTSGRFAGLAFIAISFIPLIGLFLMRRQLLKDGEGIDESNIKDLLDSEDEP